jgi:NhaA family Na+:H+ antiporter
MIVPALLYLSLNFGTETIWSWNSYGYRYSFCIGNSFLFRKQSSYFIKSFLTALAVIDDLGAILVIAILYK